MHYPNQSAKGTTRWSTIAFMLGSHRGITVHVMEFYLSGAQICKICYRRKKKFSRPIIGVTLVPVAYLCIIPNGSFGMMMYRVATGLSCIGPTNQNLVETKCVSARLEWYIGTPPAPACHPHDDERVQNEWNLKCYLRWRIRHICVNFVKNLSELASRQRRIICSWLKIRKQILY